MAKSPPIQTLTQAVTQVDTRNPSKPEQGSWLSMAVLMSYKNMGMATLQCVRNCECRPMTIDALWTTRMSIKARAQPLPGILGSLHWCGVLVELVQQLWGMCQFCASMSVLPQGTLLTGSKPLRTRQKQAF